MNEITVKPLVDILSLQLVKQVVMSGDKYVLLEDSSVVTQSVVDVALVEQKAEFDKRTQEATIAHFKQLYLKVIADKLKELDYDSMTTVKLWEGDATFGAEATKILDWNKTVIAYNYNLITSGTIPTDEVYLLDMPKYI